MGMTLANPHDRTIEELLTGDAVDDETQGTVYHFHMVAILV